MKTILILGGTGLLGTNLSSSLSSNYKVIRQGFSKASDIRCDLTQKDHVIKLLKTTRPDYIINSVAETSVEKCNENPVAAFNLNVLPTINLKTAFNELNIQPHLVHISTDHFYNNHFSTEQDLVFLNNYALTKYWAERELEGTGSTILRTNFFGGDTDFKLSFSGWVLSMLNKKEPFMGFDDVYFSPLHVSSFGDFLPQILNLKLSGVFNFGASSELSKYDFIQKVAKLSKLDGSMCTPTKYDDSNIKTPRPHNMSMNVVKIEKALNIKLPSLQTEITKI